MVQILHDSVYSTLIHLLKSSQKEGIVKNNIPNSSLDHETSINWYKYYERCFNENVKMLISTSNH